jgi:LysR family transcriptional regulator (chromosome initiation inhibitor)
MHFQYDQLSALVAVIREGSFDRAASVLHVTPSAISQRIKQLEEHVGGVVVVRGSPCTTSRVGETVYRHALQVELLEKDLLGSIAPSKAQAAIPSTPMTVAVNADSLATWLIPALARFVEQTGQLVEIVVDDQDHTAEWLRSGRVLGAITAEARPVLGCRVEPLGVMRYRATASPAFVRRWFESGVSVKALRKAPALIFNRRDELQERFLHRVLGARAGQLQAHVVPSPTAFIEASLLGLGWGMNPEKLADVHLKSKRLVELLPGKWLDVPLFWQQWALASESLNRLAAALGAEASTALRAM